MYISTSKTTKNGKTHVTYMLRHSYRENGKVKQRNIGCLNNCSDEEIAAIRFALKNKNLVANMQSATSFKFKQGKSFGGVFATHQIAKSLKIDKALGDDEPGKIALMQVLARVIGQGSKLKAVRMQNAYALPEIIGLKEQIGDDKIYRNLDWLTKNQLTIEKKLWKYNAHKQENHIFLYDVTSTYLEGQANEYAAFGYNRDGKKAKKQIVIGLLTNHDGMPLKTTVYDGNTSDTKTFAEQVKASAEQFGAKNVVFVGDRGMIKSPQIKELPAGCKYITAISKKEIETLIKEGTIQLGLFDQNLREVMVEETGVRYILRCNPVRQKEIHSSRQAKIRKIIELMKKGNERLQEKERAKFSTLHNKISAKITQYKLDALLELQEAENENDRIVKIKINRAQLKKSMELDGCYIIKSNVEKEVSKEDVHARYKDLKLVEDSFRTMKQSHLELRPVYVRKKSRTAAHVFVVMLAYMIVRKMRQLLALNGEEILTQEVIASLDMICLHEALGSNELIYRLPEPSDVNASYLKRLQITLPEVFMRGLCVDSKK